MKMLPLLLAAAPFACAAGGVIDLVKTGNHAQPGSTVLTRLTGDLT